MAAHAMETRCSRSHIKAGTKGSLEHQQGTALLLWLSALPHASCSHPQCCRAPLLPLQHPHPHDHILAPLCPLCHPVPLLPQEPAQQLPLGEVGNAWVTPHPQNQTGSCLEEGPGFRGSAPGARLAPTCSTAHKRVVAHGSAPLAVVPATGHGQGRAHHGGCRGTGELADGLDGHFAEGKEGCKEPTQLQRHIHRPRAPLQVGDAAKTCGAGKTSDSLPMKWVCFTLSHPCPLQTHLSAPTLVPASATAKKKHNS